MPEQTNLEKIAIQERLNLLTFNAYKNNIGNRYGATHPNALSDGDSKGKGTGVYLDTSNGGSKEDIFGTNEIPGSGRIEQIKRNKYNVNSPYLYPDTTGNEDQYRVPM